jgi:hypothetical protein
MELPPGVSDPIFLCELALELRMPVSELADRMSAHELTVIWPAFFRHRQREAEREKERQAMKARRR